MFYSFILVPLPVTNLMLRQADFSDENANDNSTVNVIVTWKEVRMLYIILYYDVYFHYYSHLHLLVLL